MENIPNYKNIIKLRFAHRIAGFDVVAFVDDVEFRPLSVYRDKAFRVAPIITEMQSLYGVEPSTRV